MSSDPSKYSTRRKFLPYITKIAHGSSPFITTFVLIHLAAPALANLGGSSLASQTMLLGREYYQTKFGEKYLLLGPLAVHSLAGLAKRVLSPPKSPPRPLSSALSVTGYAVGILLLPIHFMTHRYSPTSSAAPILSVGPSELDYEFVKLGLRNWPIRSWLLYGGLVIFTTVHMVDGMSIFWNTYARETVGKLWRKSKRRRNLIIAFTGIILPVLSGVYILGKEPLMTFASIAKRYQATFMSSIVYRV